jgi:CheY-like chemotaxis protein
MGVDLNKRTHVLLVDSQAAKLKEPLEELLNLSNPKAEYDVAGTRDPEEALEFVRTKRIHVAILELDVSVCGDYESKQLAEKIKNCLPEIQEEHIGYKLTRYIKKEYPQTRSIILASYGMCGNKDDDERANAFSKGADGFVLKPFAMKELVEAIEKTLSFHNTQ